MSGEANHYVMLVGWSDESLHPDIEATLRLLHGLHGERLRLLHGLDDPTCEFIAGIATELNIPTKTFPVETTDKARNKQMTDYLTNVCAARGHTVQVISHYGRFGRDKVTDAIQTHGADEIGD